MAANIVAKTTVKLRAEAACPSHSLANIPFVISLLPLMNQSSGVAPI